MKGSLTPPEAGSWPLRALEERSFHVSPKTPHVCSFAQSSLALCHPLDCVACQAPLSMGFFRQEYWSGLPFSSSQGSSQPRNQTCVSCTSYIVDGLFTHWAVRTPGEIWIKRFCQASPSSLPLPHVLLSCQLFSWLCALHQTVLKNAQIVLLCLVFISLWRLLCHVKLILNKYVLLSGQSVFW